MKHFSEYVDSAERVMDAAQALIQQRGYNGFSYDDIAKVVGIKKPSIHHHFATKGDLVAVVTQRYVHRFREHLLRIEGQHAKAPDRLRAYGVLFEQTYHADRHCLCGMLGAEADGLPAQVRDELSLFFSVNVDWLSSVIEAGQQAKQLTGSSPARYIAQTYLCALEGALAVGRGMREAQGPAALGEVLIDALART